MEINTLTDLSTSYANLVFDISNYTEFTFIDEYFSDWEVFDYSKSSSDIDDLSRSLPQVDYIPRSPEATEHHLSTSEESRDDPGYVSSKMSTSSGSNKSIQEWSEDPNDVLGIEYYEPTLQMPGGSPTHILSFNDFMEGINATSELHDRSKCCTHNTSAVLHCQTCNDFLCIPCKVNHYITHDVKVTDGAMQSLAESKKRCRQKLDETRRHLAEVHQYQKDVTQKRRLVKEQLRHQRAALYEKIESEFEKLNTQVELVWSQEIVMTNTKIQSLFHQIEDEQKHLEEIEKLLKICCDNETFSKHKQTVQVHKNSNNSLMQSQNDALGLADLTLALDLDLTSRSSFHRQYFILNQDGDSNTCHLGQFSTGSISGTNLKTCLVSRGRIKSSFKTRGRQGMSHMASGLSVTPEGHFVVTDLGRDFAAVYDKDGQRRVTLNILPQDEPSATEQMDNGSFLVACKDGLKLLSERGHLLRSIETSIDSPRGIACTSAGTIVVTDQEPTGSLIHILSSRDFRCIHTIIGGTRAPLFTQAWYVATDDSTNIIISDSAEHTVKILSSHGMLMYEFGGRGCKPGQFFFPAGICVDAYGHILVADMGNNRIQMFSKTGEFLAVILNSEDDLQAPTDLTVDSDLDLIILQGNGEVKVVQYIF